MDTTEFIRYANEQLATEGLRLAEYGEAGWYYNVLDEDRNPVSVWVTDEPMPIDEIE